MVRMYAMDAEVLYLQLTSNFPSWTSRVRSPSPALKINNLGIPNFTRYSVYSVFFLNPLSFLKMSSAPDLTIHQGQTRSGATRRRIWKAVEAATTSIWSREIGANSTVTLLTTGILKRSYAERS